MAYKINGTTVVDNSRNVCACCVTSCCITASDRMDVPSGDTASRPGSPATGSLYFDTDEGALVAYNGTEWASIGAAEGVAKYGLQHGIDDNRLQRHWVSYGNNYSHVGSKMGAQSNWYQMTCSGITLEGCHYYCTPEGTHEKTGRCLFLLCWCCSCHSPDGCFGSASNSCFCTALNFKAHGWIPSINAGEYDSCELATPMFHMSDGNRECTSKPNTIGFLRKGSNGCYFLQGKCLCPSTCCCFCWMQFACSAWRCSEVSSGDAMGKYGSYHKMGSNFSCCKYIFNFSTQAASNPVQDNNRGSLVTIMNCWCPANLYNDVCTAPSGNQCMSQHESCWTDTRIFFGGVMRAAYNCKCKRLWFANNRRLVAICAAEDGQFSYCSCFTEYCLCEFSSNNCYFCCTGFTQGAAKCDGSGLFATNKNGVDQYLIQMTGGTSSAWYFKGGTNSNTNCCLAVHFTHMDCDGCIHVFLNAPPDGVSGKFQFYQLILNGCGGLENNSSPAPCVLVHRLRLTNALAGSKDSRLCCWETFESPQVSKGWVGGSMKVHGGLNLLTGLIGGYHCSAGNKQVLNEAYPAGYPVGPSYWNCQLNYPIGFSIPASLKTAGTISDGSNGICWITVNCANNYSCTAGTVNNSITACIAHTKNLCQKCAGKFCNNCGYSLFLGYRLGDKCCDLGNGQNGLKGTQCGCGGYKNCCAGPDGYKVAGAGISRDTLSL